MIVILGSTHDDILYFESIMTTKKESTILNKYPAISGSIFNQEVLLVYDVYTSYVSSSIITHLNDKSFVLLVFNVGKCTAFSDDLRLGDIVVSERTYLGDVDQMEETTTKLGQIPGFEQYFDTQDDVLESLDKSLEIRTFIPNKRGTFISSNIAYKNNEQLNHIRADKSLYGETSNIVLDSTLGGVAVACDINKIPFVGVKVVYKSLGEKSTANAYANVLKSYTGVGKAIVTCIGNISRNEIIREEE